MDPVLEPELTILQTFEAQNARDDEKRTWNSLLVHFYQLSVAHSQYMLIKWFHESLYADATSLPPIARSVLRDLFQLFALTTMDAAASEFFASNAVTPRQFRLVKRKIMTLLESIRPHTLKIVDSFALPDFLLNRYLHVGIISPNHVALSGVAMVKFTRICLRGRQLATH